MKSSVRIDIPSGDRHMLRCVIFIVVVSCAAIPTLFAADAPAAKPSLDPVLGAGSAEKWNLVSGTFRVEADPALKQSVISVDTPIVLDSKAAVPAPMELRALVRFHDGATTPSMAISTAKKDAADAGFRFQFASSPA